MRHYRTIDPNQEWASRPLAKLARLRVLVPAFSINTIITAGCAVAKEWQYTGIGVVTGISIGLVGYIVRHFLLKNIKVEQSLHAFVHVARDQIGEINDCVPQAECVILIGKFNDLVVQNIATHFRVRNGGDDFGAAIRLAENVNGEECYVTKARFGLDPARQATTEPLGKNEGMAGALRDKDTQGVYIVNDVQNAFKQPGWKPMRNDSMEDVKALMAAPINGWDAGSKSMFGILCITSKSQKFYAGDTEAVKIFADVLGSYYTAIWAKAGPQLKKKD